MRTYTIKQRGAIFIIAAGQQDVLICQDMQTAITTATEADAAHAGQHTDADNDAYAEGLATAEAAAHA